MPSDAALAFASIAEIGKLYRARKLSPVELTRFLLDRIATLNPRLNAYLTVCEEQALQQAARAESHLPANAAAKPPAASALFMAFPSP